MQSKKQKTIYKCGCVKENGVACGNPLYAVVDGLFVMKRHGREFSLKFKEGQRARIKCERCGCVTEIFVPKTGG